MAANQRNTNLGGAGRDGGNSQRHEEEAGTDAGGNGVRCEWKSRGARGADHHARAARDSAVLVASDSATSTFVERTQGPVSLQGGGGIARGKRSGGIGRTGHWPALLPD